MAAPNPKPTITSHANDMSPPRSQRTLHFVGITVLAAGLFAWLLWSAATPFDPYDDRSFSAAAWSAADGNERAPMVRSLMNDHLRVGMTEAEVAALLGKPWVQIGKDRGGNLLAGSKSFAYYIGHLTFDDTYFYVHFDGRGALIRSEINGY